MGFLNFRNLFRLIAWSLGGQIHPVTRNSTGFDSSNFLPEERQRNLFERSLTLCCSFLTLAVLLQPVCLKFEILSWFYQFFSAHVELIALPGVVWSLYMLIPQRRPMDRVAIGVGGFTLTPWFIPYVVGILFGSREDLICLPLWLHLLAYCMIVVSGLVLDVRLEMQSKEAARQSRQNQPS